MMETSKRILAKAITFRILITFLTIFIVFVITGSTHVAIGIGIIDAIVRFVLYYIHEKAWNDIEWGISIRPEVGKEYRKLLDHRNHFDDNGKPKNLLYASMEEANKFEKQLVSSLTGKR